MAIFHENGSVGIPWQLLNFESYVSTTLPHAGRENPQLSLNMHNQITINLVIDH